MSWLFPWILLFFFLFFCGIFLLVFYCTRTQDRALRSILQQQQAMRMELDRLACALDSLLADRLLADEDDVPAVESAPASSDPASAALGRGIDRLLLKPAAAGGKADAPSMPVEAGLPDLKI